MARLAGVPLKVTQRAKEVLNEVESESLGHKGKSSATYTQLMLFDPGGSEALQLNPVVETLKGLNIDGITPLEALNKLHELKNQAGGNGGSE